MKTTLHAGFLALAALFSHAASAQLPDIYNPYTGNPLDQAHGFNVITKKEFKSKGGQIQGPVAFGGDLEIIGNSTIAGVHSGYFPTSKNNDNGNYSLVVGGKVKIKGGKANVNKGFVRLNIDTTALIFDKDCNGAAINLQVKPKATTCNTSLGSNQGLQLQHQQPASTAVSASGVDFNAAFSWFTQLSQAINVYGSYPMYIAEIVRVPVPATTTINPKLTIVKDKINFVQLTAAQLTSLANQGTLTFSNTPSSSTPVVFNIIVPNGYTWTPPNIGGLADSANHYIVWHLSNGNAGLDLTIAGSNSIPGTVLAPMANVFKTTSNTIKGQLIANTVEMVAGDMNYYPFLGRMASFAPTPLPVKLVSFNGQVNNNKASLQWNVAQNEQGAYFEIEKSTDSRNFSTIGQVHSTGKSGSESYTFTDGSNSLGYYRLKMVSKSAFPSYSGIIRLQAEEGTSLRAELLQNPVANSLPLRVTAPRQGMATVQVYALSGARIMSRNVLVQKGSNSLALTLESSLPKGTYLVEVLVNGERSMVKMIK